jgi:hypothetical protein
MDEPPAELTELFRRLGARDPAAWARSQRQEGIPQLARFLFLRQAWKQLVGRDSPAWAEALRARPGPGGEATLAALDRMAALGVSDDDLTTVVRHMQRELLFSICYLLADPGELEPEVRDMAWGLFQLDAAGRPGAEIALLHESVIETDPERDERPAG